MIKLRNTKIGVCLTAGFILTLFACQMTVVSAEESVASGAVLPEAGFWAPNFSGTPPRMPGNLDAFAGPSVGSVVLRDLDRDQVAEIIVGSGFGQGPSVGIFDGDGSLVRRLAVYDPGMRQGVNVAAGDIDGDGLAEIIVGTRQGAVAHVLVLDDQGRMKSIAGGFFPFGREFRGGVSVAVGDVDGDGTDEIITAAGPGGEPRVMIWKKPFSSPTADFLAFDENMTMGVNIAVGDVDGDGRDEILVALTGRADESIVRIFEAGNLDASVGEFKAGDGLSAGLNLVSGDLDGDGLAEIVVTTNGPGLGQVSVFDRAGKVRTSFLAGEATYEGGVLVAVGRPNTSVGNLILTVPAVGFVSNRPTEPKSITVNITEQRLRAYEYGREVKTFLVSTGLRKSPTPLGNFSVSAKVPTVIYRWSYGPDHPDNYDLGPTPWNLRIVPHIYIHYAPWHNNFGRRASHGCINVDLTNIKWLYGWAEVGVPVDVSE